eukprot:COSAG02_NODE_428_length_22489_cov_4.690219_3_plen_252_part_00
MSGAQVVLPGDTVVSLEGHEGTVRVGVGLVATGGPSSAIVATKAGVVQHAALRKSQGGGDRYQVLNHQKKYAPAQGDSVLGVVIEKHGESYSVDIGGPHRAALNGIAFEGASRRNRPHLEVGSLVHAHVTRADKHVEPEVSCVSTGSNTKGWMTGDSMYGPLVGGYMFETSLDLANSLLHDNSIVLLELERIKLAFELATANNGRVWIKSADPAQTIFVSNVIARSEFAQQEDIRAMIAAASGGGSGGSDK